MTADLDLDGLVRRLTDRPLTPSDLDDAGWRWMVERVTGAVQHEGAELDDDGWASCSAVLVELLDAAVAAGAYTPHEALVRRLHLTGFASGCAKEPRDGVALLDVVRAIDLAIGALPKDVDGVARDAARWRTLPRAQVLRLRHVKNLLTPALALGVRWGDRRLADWDEVYRCLP